MDSVEVRSGPRSLCRALRTCKPFVEGGRCLGRSSGKWLQRQMLAGFPWILGCLMRVSVMAVSNRACVAHDVCISKRHCLLEMVS